MAEPGEKPVVFWSGTSLLIQQGRIVIEVPQEQVRQFAEDVRRQAGAAT